MTNVSTNSQQAADARSTHLDPSTISSMKRDELLALHDRLSEEASRMKTQIANAKADLLVRGAFSDPDWWTRVNTALRITGRYLQKIQARLGQLRTEEKDRNRASMSRRVVSQHVALLHAFYRNAKATMEPDDFAQMCAEATATALLDEVTCERCGAEPRP